MMGACSKGERQEISSPGGFGGLELILTDKIVGDGLVQAGQVQIGAIVEEGGEPRREGEYRRDDRHQHHDAGLRFRRLRGVGHVTQGREYPAHDHRRQPRDRIVQDAPDRGTGIDPPRPGIGDAPDDETMTAYALSLASLGNVKTLTLRAYRAKEVDAILAKMPK